MFETPEFREQIVGAVSSEAARNGLSKYAKSIIDYIRDLAVANEQVLMERERQKTIGRRGIPEALASVAVLIGTASQYALSERTDTLQLGHVQRAYQANFCRLWPLCK